MALSHYKQTLNDNTLNKRTGQPESAHFRVPIITATPATIANIETLVGNLKVAINGISNGVFSSSEIVYSGTDAVSTRAASTSDQRENKWMCRYHDATTGRKSRVTIPVADLSVLADGEEFLDLTADPGLAFKTAFEAIVRDEVTPGNSIVLDSVQFVGRNL